MDTSATPHGDPSTGPTTDPSIDPDGDPANLPSPQDTSGTPPTRGPQDTLPVQEDPDDRDDPDADPGMLADKR